jgi:hypothetical protein
VPRPDDHQTYGPALDCLHLLVTELRNIDLPSPHHGKVQRSGLLPREERERTTPLVLERSATLLRYGIESLVLRFA